MTRRQSWVVVTENTEQVSNLEPINATSGYTRELGSMSLKDKAWMLYARKSHDSYLHLVYFNSCFDYNCHVMV